MVDCIHFANVTTFFFRFVALEGSNLGSLGNLIKSTQIAVFHCLSRVCVSSTHTGPLLGPMNEKGNGYVAEAHNLHTHTINTNL
eukprot:NODE_2416_length_358_cov_140.519481_g2406_i0.p1 GENE.NODE_2416_length_358_cov_140.519481_g2406_i0~~NODE_2416_length_358_cov_140.519481_g2406_i0.p1  ORF type:complete len:84 (-),score=4.06 NODE_2416_length_358_cov_140.519481_g2406_i0:19-270(-)